MKHGYMQHAGAVFQADVAFRPKDMDYKAGRHSLIVLAVRLDTLDGYPLGDNVVVSVAAVSLVVDLNQHN